VTKKGKHIKINQEADKAYFDKLTDEIMNRVELEDSLLYRDSSLKALPFTTPDGYFDQLGDKMMSNSVEPKVIPLYANTWLKYAAAVILLFVVAVFTLKPADTETNNLLADISEDAIIEYASTEESALDELFLDEEVMEIVLDDLMADIAFTYEDMIDFEQGEFFSEGY